MALRDELVKMARPGEPEVVKTTIVGGQPPREGRSIGNVPRGIEVLVKKAAVDPAFKKALLDKRAGAADAIALKLSPAEAAMLDAVPESQLHAIIANTKVSRAVRPAFLGYAAGVMLAALSGIGCKNRAPENTPYPPPSTGINSDIPETGETASTAEGGIPYGANNPGEATNNKASEAGAEPEIRGGLCLGARADRPLRGKDETFLVKKSGGKTVRLTKSLPISVTGSGAQDPKRSPTTISNVFERHLSGISGAYRSALKKNVALGPGTIQVIITIDADGIVRSGSIASDDIGDEFLNSTILARIRGWLFPPIERG